MDISFDDSDGDNKSSVFYGIETIQLVKEMIQQQPVLKTLSVVLKKLLYLHKLNMPYFGKC